MSLEFPRSAYTDQGTHAARKKIEASSSAYNPLAAIIAVRLRFFPCSARVRREETSVKTRIWICIPAETGKPGPHYENVIFAEKIKLDSNLAL